MITLHGRMRRALTGLSRLIGTALFFIVVALCLAIVLVPPFLDRIYYRGEQSDHYDGQRFFNPDGEDGIRIPGGGSRGGFIARWILGNDGRPVWPDAIAVKPSKPAPRVEGDAMVATWVGHATVLVQTQGLNILTDPIWSDIAGPFNIAGPRRIAEPGIRFEDLPKIDLIVVSHNHYDHMDLPTLKRLWERDRPLIVTSLGNDSVIGLPAKAVDWGTRVAVKPGVEVVVTRNHHWGSRWGTDRNRALWSAFSVRTPHGNIIFAGDTGWGDGAWVREAARAGPYRLAIIPIGAYLPRDVMRNSHVGPQEALAMFRVLDPRMALAVHWGTFQLSFEGMDQPARVLADLQRRPGLASGRFIMTAVGQPLSAPAR